MWCDAPRRKYPQCCWFVSHGLTTRSVVPHFGDSPRQPRLQRLQNLFDLDLFGPGEQLTAEAYPIEACDYLFRRLSKISGCGAISQCGGCDGGVFARRLSRRGPPDAVSIEQAHQHAEKRRRLGTGVNRSEERRVGKDGST